MTIQFLADDSVRLHLDMTAISVPPRLFSSPFEMQCLRCGCDNWAKRRPPGLDYGSRLICGGCGARHTYEYTDRTRFVIHK